MKTILFVHNSNDLYGAEVILLNLLRGLDRSRYRILVALPEDMQHLNQLSVCLEEAGIPCLFLPLGVLRRRYCRPRYILRYAFEVLRGTFALVRLIRSEGVDLVHTNTLTVFSAVFAARITGRPHLWHVHEISTSGLRRLLHWLCTHLSQQVVTVSDAVRRNILKDQGWAANRVRTIRNGIELEPYLVPRDGTAVRRELGIPSGALVVGMVGRVSRWKGQPVFVEAARQILSHRPDLYFVAVGGVFDNEHQYMDAFQKLVSSYGLRNFRICDFRQDIPQVLAAFNLFVLPSTEPDPFPTVIIEALASGLPVLGANHGGVPEMIEAGIDGMLVRPGDAGDLAAAILTLIDDPMRLIRMGICARERARRQFQLSDFVKEFEAVYDLIIRDHPEGPIQPVVSARPARD